MPQRKNVSGKGSLGDPSDNVKVHCIEARDNGKGCAKMALIFVRPLRKGQQEDLNISLTELNELTDGKTIVLKGNGLIRGEFMPIVYFNNSRLCKISVPHELLRDGVVYKWNFFFQKPDPVPGNEDTDRISQKSIFCKYNVLWTFRNGEMLAKHPLYPEIGMHSKCLKMLIKYLIFTTLALLISQYWQYWKKVRSTSSRNMEEIIEEIRQEMRQRDMAEQENEQANEQAEGAPGDDGN